MVPWKSIKIYPIGFHLSSAALISLCLIWQICSKIHILQICRYFMENFMDLFIFMMSTIELIQRKRLLYYMDIYCHQLIGSLIALKWFFSSSDDDTARKKLEKWFQWNLQDHRMIVMFKYNLLRFIKILVLSQMP